MPYSTYTNTAIGVFFGIFAEFFGSSGNIQIKYRFAILFASHDPS